MCTDTQSQYRFVMQRKRTAVLDSNLFDENNSNMSVKTSALTDKFLYLFISAWRHNNRLSAFFSVNVNCGCDPLTDLRQAPPDADKQLKLIIKLITATLNQKNRKRI